MFGSVHDFRVRDMTCGPYRGLAWTEEVLREGSGDTSRLGYHSVTDRDLQEHLCAVFKGKMRHLYLLQTHRWD